MRPRTDPSLEEDITRLMCCATHGCHREHSCFRVARFARDKMMEMHANHESLNDDELEQYAITQLYARTGSWEAA